MMEMMHFNTFQQLDPAICAPTLRTFHAWLQRESRDILKTTNRRLTIGQQESASLKGRKRDRVKGRKEAPGYNIKM